MRRILPSFVILSLLVSACARPTSSGVTSFGDNAGADVSNSTGAANAEGKEYISGGDPRVGSTVVGVQPSVPKTSTPNANPVAQALDQEDDSDTPPPPVAPKTVPAPVVDNTLKGRIREFEIARFDKNSDVARRFGSATISIKIFSRDNHILNFEKMQLVPSGSSGHKFSFKGTKGDYVLTGNSLEDITTKDGSEIYKSTGDFDLTDAKRNDKAKIWYNAYKARLQVHEDLENPVKAGSTADVTLKSLQNDTFGWVHNWGVDAGAGFYLVDIVRRIHSDQPNQVNPVLPVFAFKGESVKTDDGPSKAEPLTPGYENVQTVGNAQNEGLHLVEAQIADQQTQDKTNFLIDIIEDNPDVKAPPEEVANNNDAIPGDDETQVQPAPQEDDSQQPDTSPSPRTSAPKTKKSTTPPAPKAAKITASYLPINMAHARAKRLDHDVLATSNRSLRGVTELIASKDLRTKMSNFFWYAAPLRSFIELIADTLQTSAAFIYPAAVESQYFQGAAKGHKAYNNLQYHWDQSILAVGPFQMHWDTAKDLSVGQFGNSKDKNDERLYFAPAACGAAVFLNKNMSSFMDGDTTFALLAYNQGAGGAKRLAKKYGERYYMLSRASANINEAFRVYGDRQIAMYIIAREMTSNGFSPSQYNNTDLSAARGTINPPRPIQNATCRQLVQTAGLSGY